LSRSILLLKTSGLERWENLFIGAARASLPCGGVQRSIPKTRFIRSHAGSIKWAPNNMSQGAGLGCWQVFWAPHSRTCTLVEYAKQLFYRNHATTIFTSDYYYNQPCPSMPFYFSCLKSSMYYLFF
jgi:hypothetical protein